MTWVAAMNARFPVRRRQIRTVAALGLLAVALSMVGGRADSAEAPAAEPDDGHVQDLLFCATSQPLLIRLHLTVNGKGFRSLRRQWVEAQFAALDRDGNGFLENDEIKQMPLPETLQPGATAESTRALRADSDPADGKVSLAEFSRSLLAATVTPFSVVTQPNEAQVNLFPKLDADQDGRLSREEIASAAAQLRRHDRNEDDIVTGNELQQGLPEQAMAAQQQLSGALGMLIIVDNADHGLKASRRLLESYDKATRDPATRTFRKDERLSRSELSIDAGAFDRADRNRDGKLDWTELGLLSSAMTPSVELFIKAPSETGKFSVSALRPSGADQDQSVDVRQNDSGRWLLVLNDTAFALDAAGPSPSQEQQLRNTYLSQFKSLDQDKNDYLERAEMQRFGFQDSFFTQADGDGDGKMFETEYAAHIEREIELSKTGFVLEIGGDGRSLFRLLDSSPADGRLSLRELGDASAKLMQWDANGDGSITLTELSIALNAVFRAGTPRVNGPFAIRPLREAQANLDRRPRGAPGDVPSWFSKMDRNSDGDLSPKEFLGRRALFDKIDRDGDGLISPDEANTAHRDAVATSPP